MAANRREHKIDSGELSSDKRSLLMSENRMRQYVWKGVCMFNNNRYQHISIGIHTEMGGGTCIHIAIGVEAGAMDMFWPTGQTGHGVKSTQRGPLNYYRDYPLSLTRYRQLSD